MSRVYHCTTPKKLHRYEATGAILPPVRYWLSEGAAREWLRKTGRTVLLAFERPDTSYPLPDHRPRGMAHWSPCMVREWEELTL